MWKVCKCWGKLRWFSKLGTDFKGQLKSSQWNARTPWNAIFIVSGCCCCSWVFISPKVLNCINLNMCRCVKCFFCRRVGAVRFVASCPAAVLTVGAFTKRIFQFTIWRVIETLVQESSVNWERHAEYMLWLAHRWSDKQDLSLLPRVEVTQRKRCFHALYAALNSCIMNCMAEKGDVKWADCVKGYNFACVEMREAFKWAAK